MPTSDPASTQLADELHARRRDLEMVVRAVHRLIRYTEPRPLFEAMSRVGADALGTDRCGVLTKISGQDALTWGGTLGVSGAWIDDPDQRGIPLDLDTPSTRAFREQRPIVTSDVATDPLISEDVRQAILADGIKATLCCPIVAEGEPLGVLAVYYREPRAFHPAEVRRLTLLAEICAVAVQNAIAFERTRAMSDELARKAADLERRNTELRIVADLAPTLAVADSPKKVLSAFFSHTTTLVPFEQAALMRLDPSNPKEIVIREVYSTSPASFNRGWRTVWDGTLAEEPLVLRKATARTISPGMHLGPIGRLALQLGLRSLGFFPLIAGREVLGLLMVGSVRPDCLDPATVATLEPICAQVAGALARLDEPAHV